MVQGLGLFIFVVGLCFFLSGSAILGWGFGYLGAKLMMSGD